MALSVDTSIATPSGWLTAGSVDAGEEVLTGNGSPSTVASTTDPMEAELFRVTFIDGQYVDVTADHPWRVITQDDKAAARSQKRQLAIRRWDERSLFLCALADVAAETDTDRCLSLDEIFGRLTRLDGSMLWPSPVSVARALRTKGLGARAYPARSAYRALFEAGERRLGARPEEVAKPRWVTTAGMMTVGLRMSNGWRYSIPLPTAIDLPDRALPLDPYVLGVWLGDGTCRDGYINAGAQDADEIVDLLRAHWPRVDQAVIREDGLRRISLGRDMTRCVYGHQDWRPTPNGQRACRTCMREVYPLSPDRRPPRCNETLGLRVRRLGWNQGKHLPIGYLRASRTQRLLLLQGLMDTDGHVGERGTCTYVSHDEQLASSVLELVRSLGIRASLRGRPAVFRGRDLGMSWKVYFTTAEPVTRLTRKATRLPAQVHPKATYLSVVNIERAGTGLVRDVILAKGAGTVLAGGLTLDLPRSGP